MLFPTAEFNEIFETPDPLEGIVSIWGDFGVGKTTLALQIAVNASKAGKKVVYIYSKPNFPFEKVNNILSAETEEKSKEVLENIIFINSLDLDDLNTIVFNLEFLILSNLAEKDTMLNLVVIDSLTDLYRIELDREKKDKNVKLNYLLSQILANLFYINETYCIEMLVVNELAKKNVDGISTEMIAGGNVMDYWINYAVKISRTENLNQRNLSLTKHPEYKKLEILLNLRNKGFE